MFLLPRRQIWTQQPQGAVEIDWTHPLAKGLDFAWTPGNQGLDVALKRPLTIAGATRSVSAQGVGLGFSGGLGALRFASNADLAWTQNPTIIWVAATAAAVNRTILGSRTTPGLLSAFLITMPDYSLRLEGQNYGSSGFSYQAASTPGIVDGKTHCFAVAKRGNSYHQFYRDGYTISTTTLTSGPVYRQDNAVFEVGGINTGIASYDHNEPFGCFLIFRAPISDADIKALTLNPWQIFKRPDSRIFVPVSAGGGTTTVTSDAAASYKVQGSVQSSSVASYGIHSTIQSNSAASYAIRAAIQQDAASAYSIRGSIQQSSTPAYLIRALVDQTVTASYGIRTAVSSDASATYNILSATSVSSSATAGYNIRGSINQGAATSYFLRGSAVQAAIASYALRSSVTQNTTATYSILSASSVSSSVTAGYAIKGSVQSSIVAGFSIAQAVQAEIAASYIIRSGVVSEAQAAYVIRGLVQQSITASYAIDGTAFTGSISDADITRIVQAVLLQLNNESIAAAVWAHATRVITGPTPNDNADALLARNWP